MLKETYVLKIQRKFPDFKRMLIDIVKWRLKSQCIIANANALVFGMHFHTGIVCLAQCKVKDGQITFRLLTIYYLALCHLYSIFLRFITTSMNDSTHNRLSVETQMVELNLKYNLNYNIHASLIKLQDSSTQSNTIANSWNDIVYIYIYITNEN